MKRFLVFIFTLSLVLPCAQQAEAGWGDGWHAFWQRMELDRKRANCWPEPWVHYDREVYNAPFTTMINNGWRAENTLTDFHFDGETQKLTRAGELKLRNILIDTPEHRRSVFVLAGTNRETTSIRVDSVQNATSRVVGQGPLPEVLQTTRQPRNWSADYIDAVLRADRGATPTPRLPPFQAAGQ
jgi:hypothetical protein